MANPLEAALDSPSRNKGLLGRSSLPDGHGLVLAPCTSIHTFFMQFPIDVLFVRRDGRVVKVQRALGAWRLAAAWRAFAVVELPVGTIDRSETRIGDQLEVELG